MENDNLVSGLLRKRSEIAGKIEGAQAELRQLLIDLDNVDYTIRLFRPEIDLEEVRPKPLPPRFAAFKGEVSRVVFETLRDAKGPMTSQQLAAVLMKERGMNTNDKHTVQLMVRRVGACLKHHRNKGVLRSVRGPDGFILWESAR